MDRQRALLPTLLVWAMLPLTVLSGSPRSACLCSNGDLKLFCGAAKAQRSCCTDNELFGDVSQHSSPRQRSCCRGSDSPPDSSAICTVAGCRCTPVVVLPDASSKVETAEAPDFDVAAHGCCRIVLIAVQPAHLQAGGMNHSPLEEGRDLVILLSRMLA
jgi:hypothetical protein